MSFLAKIFGGVAGDAIAAPVEAVGNALDKLFTSDEEKAAAAAVMEKIRQQPQILQAEINKLEATHRSVFVAGWRPFIGWICGIAIGCYYIPRFLMATAFWAVDCWNAGVAVPYPAMDLTNLNELVYALLGLGLLRTAEKITGTVK
jgi:hypothetical protein